MMRWILGAALAGCGDTAETPDTGTGGNTADTGPTAATPLDTARVSAADADCISADAEASLIVGLMGDRRDLDLTWWMVGGAGSEVTEHRGLAFGEVTETGWTLYVDEDAPTDLCPAAGEDFDEAMNNLVVALDPMGRIADCVAWGPDAAAILAGDHAVDPTGLPLPDVAGCRPQDSGW